MPSKQPIAVAGADNSHYSWVTFTQQLATRLWKQLAEGGGLWFGEAFGEPLRNPLGDLNRLGAADRRHRRQYDADTRIAELLGIGLEVLGYTGGRTAEENEQLWSPSRAAKVLLNLVLSQEFSFADFEHRRGEILIRVNHKHQEIRIFLDLLTPLYPSRLHPIPCWRVL